MYGAKADGVTDDTEAFQKAVDSGYDVYVPTARRETYLIKRPIRITKKQCKRIYSEPFRRMADTGAIVADFSEQDDPKGTALFDVRIQLLGIGGLRIVSRSADGHRAGVMVRAMEESLCDYDIRIEHCSAVGFYKVAEFTGRGLEIVDSQVGSCQYLADLYWDDGNDTNQNHPAPYDQRGICVKYCRLHSIQSGFLTVKSGHAYGLHFAGNTIDNGRGYLVKATEQAYGWNITGNVVQGMQGAFDVMEFKKGMRNCLIAGNTFLSDLGYWVGSTGTVKSWLKSGGSTSGSIISNNVFKNSDGGFLSFANMTGCAVIGNAMKNMTESTAPAIAISGKTQGVTMIGNTLVSEKGAEMFGKEPGKGCVVLGNSPGK